MVILAYNYIEKLVIKVVFAQSAGFTIDFEPQKSCKLDYNSCIPNNRLKLVLQIVKNCSLDEIQLIVVSHKVLFLFEFSNTQVW